MDIHTDITGRIATGITDHMLIQVTNITIKRGATGGVTLPDITTENTGSTDTLDIITGVIASTGTGIITSAIIITTAIKN